MKTLKSTLYPYVGSTDMRSTGYKRRYTRARHIYVPSMEWINVCIFMYHWVPVFPRIRRRSASHGRRGRNSRM